MKFFGLSLSSAIQLICSLTYSRRKQTRNNVHEIIFVLPFNFVVECSKVEAKKKDVCGQTLK